MSDDQELNEQLHRLADETSTEDLRERVRQLVLDSLSRRSTDPDALRAVMRDAVAGLGEGLSGHATHARESLKSALDGMDEALGKAVYALRLAMEEGWGEGRRFADEDLRTAYDSLKAFEDDLAATLKSTAERSQGLLREELDRLREHMARGGGDTAAQLKATLDVLARQMRELADEAGQDARHTAREAAGRLGAVTSGILRGLADAIDRRA